MVTDLQLAKNFIEDCEKHIYRSSFRMDHTSILGLVCSFCASHVTLIKLNK